MNWFDSWALTLTILIPAVGAVVIDAHPARRGGGDQVRRAALDARHLRRDDRHRLPVRVQPRDRCCSSTSTSTGSTSSTATTTSASTGSRCRCSCCPGSSPFLCVIYSWNHFPEPHNPKAFLALVLILEIGMNGTFIAQDLILFFVFFEIVLLPMFFMIGVWGGPNRQYASIKFFLFTLFGSALMLRELPGALLQGRRLAAHSRRAAQLRHGAAARAPRARVSCTARRC